MSWARRASMAMLAAMVGFSGCTPPETAADRYRMQWFREARFGMFIHYNMFSQWRSRDYHAARRRKDLTRDERDRLRLQGFTPGPDAAEHWAAVAKAAGMKYMVLTTKHAGGFCLWNSKLNRFNSVNYGPQRDVVAEFVQAARKHGLKVGFYYSLYDGRHPDGRHCRHDEAARQRLLEYTRGLLRELMTGYGRIDVLWYDQPMPLGYGGEWESTKMNRMVRRLQPAIVINDRSLTSQDFTCPEGHISAPLFPDRDWEACMTFNGTWAWNPKPPEEYLTARQIIDMLQRVSTGTGNLLLNVGPKPNDGRIHPVEVERLATVGKWLAQYGEAVYGRLDRPEALNQTENDVGAKWTRRGNTAYLWLPNWPAGDVVIRKVKARVNECSVLPDGPALALEQKDGRLILRGLPRRCPDRICGYAVLKLKFASYPR